MNGDRTTRYCVASHADPSYLVGQRFDEVVSFGAGHRNNIIRQLAVVNGARQLVEGSGGKRIDEKIYVDEENLTFDGLLWQDTVIRENLKPPKGNLIGHRAAAFIIVRASGPNGRPRISWMTAAALIGSPTMPLKIR